MKAEKLNRLTEIEEKSLTESERKGTNFRERKRLNEKIMEMCTPPNKDEYDSRGLSYRGYGSGLVA